MPDDAPPIHTFLFADLAGFTALTEAHGDEAAADLVGRFCRAISDLLPTNAERVKSIGDAVLVRADHAADALHLALRIVGEVGGRPEFPVVRAGLHTGPAVERDGDWFGATVNLAARIAGAAGDDEVLLSEATRAAAADAGIVFESRGKHRMRNVSAEVTLFAASVAGARDRGLPVDPVCRMAVEPSRALRVEHETFEFHFCSERCRERFLADPDLYTDVRRARA